HQRKKRKLAMNFENGNSIVRYRIRQRLDAGGRSERWLGGKCKEYEELQARFHDFEKNGPSIQKYHVSGVVASEPPLLPFPSPVRMLT
ncbi:MAG TPA: hypothetical protein VEG68_04440, partial [Terriglobales bacterium]|nr:hypothetical protein [Terriglobales bacterium]